METASGADPSGIGGDHERRERAQAIGPTDGELGESRPVERGQARLVVRQVPERVEQHHVAARARQAGVGEREVEERIEPRERARFAQVGHWCAGRAARATDHPRSSAQLG